MYDFVYDCFNFFVFNVNGNVLLDIIGIFVNFGVIFCKCDNIKIIFCFWNLVVNNCLLLYGFSLLRYIESCDWFKVVFVVFEWCYWVYYEDILFISWRMIEIFSIINFLFVIYCYCISLVISNR